MSFEYKGYKIERSDDSNVNLYHWRTFKRKNKETLVPEDVTDWVRVGYYNTFFGAARRLIDRLAEEAKDMNQLKEVIAEWAFIQKELDK